MFIPRNEIDSNRAEYCNKVMQLIYDKHNGSVSTAMLVEVEKMYEHFEEHVRNIYELADTMIPLVHYVRLVAYGPRNFGMDEVEYKKALNETYLVIKQYHD